MRFPTTLLVAVGLAVSCSTGRAQSLEGRPLRAFSAQVLGSGRQALEIGVDATWGLRPQPLLASTTGDLLQAPVVRYRLGLGRGEFAVGIPVYQWFSRDDGRHGVNEFGDATFFITVQALQQRPRRPALAAFFGTKLPNASEPTGLGTNESDIFTGIALSHAGPAREFRLNLGLAILGDPLQNSRQEDALTYAIAGRHGRTHAFLWEFAGRTSGKEPSRDVSLGSLRLGYAHVAERVTLDVSVLGGLEPNSGDVGLSAGATFHFGDGS